MSSPNAYIVTGATRGLGLAIARALLQDADCRVVLAVRDTERGASLARELGPRAEVRQLDCASLASVRSFAADWQGPIAGLVNNAGLQLVNGTQVSEDGFEQTVQVNHLAALLLTVRLQDWLRGGRVLFLGSGTHNPKLLSIRLYGFRGARYTNIAALARGESEPGSNQRVGADRYATSKLLNIVTTVELARRFPASQTAFFCLDPGMMAGTELARTAPRLQQLLWHRVLPKIAPLLPDSSTTERSAAAARWILREAPATSSGQIYSHDCQPSRHVWSRVHEPALGREILDDSLALLGEKPLAGAPA